MQPVSEILKEDKFFGNFINYGEHYRNSNSSIIVFVKVPDFRPGPFGNGKGTLREEFIWRRTHEAPMSPSKLVRIIYPILKSIGEQDRKVFIPQLTGKAFYSRKAGCSACPCSPGYIVRTLPYRGRRQALWLTHVDVYKAEEEQAALKAIRKNEEEFIASAMGVSA